MVSISSFMADVPPQTQWILLARDYVEGMWLMLQQPQADDFVLATGEMHSVREFTEKAFKEVGMELG